MLLSAVSVLVIVLQSLEIPEGLMNNPVVGSKIRIDEDFALETKVRSISFVPLT
jgi:hypothetical protein